MSLSIIKTPQSQETQNLQTKGYVERTQELKESLGWGWDI